MSSTPLDLQPNLPEIVSSAAIFPNASNFIMNNPTFNDMSRLETKNYNGEFHFVVTITLIIDSPFQDNRGSSFFANNIIQVPPTEYYTISNVLLAISYI